MHSMPNQGLGLEDDFDELELLPITNDRCYPVPLICQHGWIITHHRLVCKAKPNHELQEVEGIVEMPGLCNIDDL